MKKALSILIAGCLAVSLAACGSTAASSAASAADSTASAAESTAASDTAAADGQTYKVGICQLVQHVALDAATQGFKDALTEQLGDAVTFEEKNAQGDSNTCTTIINGFVSDNVDLILANATPALQAAQAANNEKEVNNLSTFKTSVNGAFANSGAADCETLQNLYAPKVEENKSDLAALKEIVSLLRRVRCQEIDAFFAAAAYAYELEPSADAAIGIAKRAVKNKEYDTAIKYFEEAANMETDPSSKAEDYYMIALLNYDQKSYSKAREYALKAASTNSSYGQPYILIGQMYAATVKTVFPNDGVLARAAYNAAIDKFEKAKQVDESCIDEANKLIGTYRAHLPSTEEIFMHPDLEKGKQFTVGGWIGERTTIR